MIDKRTDKQKVNDILRIWSQVLDKQELELWSDIAERDISHDISLTSGIRTPKTFVDAELKKYKSATAKQRRDILQSAQKTPDFSDPVSDICSEQYEPSNDPLRDQLSILPDELCVDQAFLAKLSPQTQASANRPCNQDLKDQMIAQTLGECRQEVTRIRKLQPAPPKLSRILHRNKQLLYKYLFVLKHKYRLSKRLNSVFSKIDKLNHISFRIIRAICNALVSRNLVDYNWLLKPELNISVNVANNGPMIDTCVNNFKTNCVVDTGSTYTLVPFHIWTKFKINPNMLDTKVQFNISSASHLNTDAVLGQLRLPLVITNLDGSVQNIEQNCLILRPTLEVAFILLGNDFLKNNGVDILYSQSTDQPLILINKQKLSDT